MEYLKVFSKKVKSSDGKEFNVYYAYYKDRHFTFHLTRNGISIFNGYLAMNNLTCPIEINPQILDYWIKEETYTNKDNQIANKYIIMVNGFTKNIKDITDKDIYKYTNDNYVKSQPKTLDQIIEEMQQEI